MTTEDNREDQVEDEDGRGLANRVRGVSRTIREGAVRSADVLTGGDIRKFEEFTDAATTAIVGVHQDQTELRARLERLEDIAASQRGSSVAANSTPSPLTFLIGGMALAALILGVVALVMVAA